MRPRPRLAVMCTILVLLAGSLAGCLGEEAPAEDIQPQETNNSTTNTTLPEGRAPSAGLQETNRTEAGVGGMEHKHDYWEGKRSIVVFDDRVEFWATPVFPGGGSSAHSVEFVKLPAPNLVFEGTERIEVVLSEPEFLEVPNPAAPDVRVSWRSAADSEWQAPVDLPVDTPLDIPVDPLAADMPHSVQSLWVWRLETDRSSAFESVRVTITIHKGRDVADWPGHPDFYGDGPVRKVMDEHVQTRMSGIQQGLLYGNGGTWVNPPLLISHGTTRLEVFVNVTSARSAPGVKYTGIFLEHHNATVIGPETRFGERTSDVDKPEDLGAWNFTIPVDHDGMDGPYQPESRWGFRAMATFANAAGFGFCPGCWDYEIDYHITVLAVNDDWVPSPDEDAA